MALFLENAKDLTKEERLARLKRAVNTQYFWQVLKLNLFDVGSTDVQVTDNLARPTKLLGAISPLVQSRVKLTTSRGRQLTNGFVAARSLFNLQGTNQNWTPFPSPIHLAGDERLELTAINKDDQHGIFRVCFFGVDDAPMYAPEYYQKYVAPAEKYISDGNAPDFLNIPLNVPFAGNANEEVRGEYLTYKEPLLLLGIASEFSYAQVEIKQSWNSYSWSNDRLPVWALANDTKSSFQAQFLFPEPLFIPAEGEFITRWRNDSNNPENAGQVTLLCTRP